MDASLFQSFREVQEELQKKMPGDWKVKIKVSGGYLPDGKTEAGIMQLQAVSDRWNTILEGNSAWLVRMALHYDFEGSKS